MKKSAKIIILALLAFTCVLPAFSLSAKVTFVKGKVEVNRKGSWVAVKVGDSIAENETISTGYQSEARLNLNGSVLAVAALSRVKLEELKSDSSKDTASVVVETGATRSKVSHTNNKKVDYTTRTAVAVASVRGTVYTQTAAGDTWCDEGAVAVYSAKNYRPLAIVSAQKSNSKASANTASNEISDSSPADAFVVGEGQFTNFNSDGKPVAPENNQRRAKKMINNSVLTAAQQDVVETYNVENVNSVNSTQTLVRVSLKLSVVGRN